MNSLDKTRAAIALCAFAVLFVGCTKTGKPEQPRTKLVYFGFDNRAEKPEKVLELARIWGSTPVCPHWRATVKREAADYQVLFGTAEMITIIDRQWQVLYSGGQAVLYEPHGNPDGSGINICKLTGEWLDLIHETAEHKTTAMRVWPQ